MNNHKQGIQYHTVDRELDELLSRRIDPVKKKPVVVSTGITSSHLGDERNVREFFIANHAVDELRSKKQPVIFYLFDDSFDPLNFRQLRVAVNKDKKLIAEHEKYCGMPLVLIPDPFKCHDNYSLHFQEEILKRFRKLGIYPNIIDVASLYQSSYYDFAKDIVFSRYHEIQQFLKKNFPLYTMKKLFYPLCPKCLKLTATDIKRINTKSVTISCGGCKELFTVDKAKIQGKFSWKIDVAVKWNLFKVDFEPYSKAYLDPDMGSYFIAKKLSEAFFGGYYPESINYGQIIMDKSMSYRIMPSFPVIMLNTFFVEKRKTDIELTDAKLIQLAHEYKIMKDMSYYDYCISRLPYDVFEKIQGNQIDSKFDLYYESAIAFSINFLNKNPLPQLPNKDILRTLPHSEVVKVQNLLKWVLSYRTLHLDVDSQMFLVDLTNFMKENKFKRGKIFHDIRILLGLEDSLPMYKVMRSVPYTYLSGCFMSVMQYLSDEKVSRKETASIAQRPSAIAHG